MNYLAHLFFARDHPASMVGNLWPDFVKGKPPADLPDELLIGIRTHHRVDRFTDTHPVVNVTIQRLRDAIGRYSPIIADVFYDHILARQWDDYHRVPLNRFVARAQEQLQKGRTWMPPRMQRDVDRLIEQDRLMSYRSLEGIAQTLDRMSAYMAHRFNRPVNLHPALAVLQSQRDEFTRDFQAFFPDLIQHITDADP